MMTLVLDADIYGMNKQLHSTVGVGVSSGWGGGGGVGGLGWTGLVGRSDMCKGHRVCNYEKDLRLVGFCSQGNSDNGLAPGRRQTIIWTNEGSFMRHSASMS